MAPSNLDYFKMEAVVSEARSFWLSVFLVSVCLPCSDAETPIRGVRDIAQW